MTKWIPHKIRLNFHWQINALIAIGIISLAIFASLSAGWILNQQMTQLLKEQGKQITSNLAHQSILPLLSGVGGSATSDIESLLTFTYIQSATIYTESGKVLVTAGTKDPEPFQANDKRLELPFTPVLVKEEPSYWVFKASVYDMDVFDQSIDSIDSLLVQTPALIGYVSVTMDRSSLYAIQRSLIVDNLWISIGVALLLVAIGYVFVKKLIKPLYELARLMKRAEDGEDDIRADLEGSEEIHHMARAFNTMMTALEHRRIYAEQQHDSLLKEIHEREAVEVALRNSEKHFRTVFENVVDGILIANDNGVIESANPAAIRFMDRSRGQIVDKTLIELLFPEGGQDAQAHYASAVSGESISIHVERLNKESLELSLKFSKMQVKGENKLIAILHDITESQHQKQRIEALLAQHEAIVSSIPGIIVELDHEGRFIWWNSRTEEVTGYKHEALKGKRLAQFIDEKVRGEVSRALKKAFSDGKVELHANLITTEGTTPYQFNGLLISATSKSTAPSTLLAVGMDDSESVRTQEALQQARDVALETARIKSEFLANMSHEIRTPMNGMMGMLQLIDDSGLSEEQQGYVDIALRSSEQLLNIINDILDFSKIEAGKMTIQALDYSPRALIEDAVELFAKKAHEKGIKIYSRLAPEVPPVIIGDAQRVTQVISNLIGNAIKFTEQGYVLIDVRVIEKIGVQPMLDISVVDTGIGVDEDMQAKIFDSFAQIDGSSTRKYSGTGLGLAIVKQLVELMGGRVSLTSKLGEGSNFNFTLPLKDSGTEYAGPDLKQAAICYLGSDEIQYGIIHDYLGSANGRVKYATECQEDECDVFMVEQNAINDLVAIADRMDIETARVVLLTDYQDYYDLTNFPLSMTVRKLPTPIKLSALLRECTVFDKHGSRIVEKTKPKIEVRQEPVLESGQKRILIVEDNDTNKQVIVSMLAKLGFQSDVAGNGKEALAMINKHDYKLVFMDCQMPVMDGYEATAKIREMDRKDKPRINIIAMTGNAMEGDKEKCLAAGMDAYIAKPVRLSNLKEMLAYWLE